MANYPDNKPVSGVVVEVRAGVGYSAGDLFHKNVTIQNGVFTIPLKDVPFHAKNVYLRVSQIID